MYKVPILIIGWQRPGITRRLVEIVKVVNPTYLYLACDGKTGDGQVDERIEQTREVMVSCKEWCKHARFMFSEHNRGCRLGVTSAIDWFFENEESGIVLEDDCHPQSDMFRFMELALEQYADNERVWNISALNLHYKRTSFSGKSFYTKYAHIWGWATWRECWSRYDRNMELWPLLKESRFFRSWSKSEQTYWTKIFDDVSNGLVDTWDYQWQLTLFWYQGLTLLPPVNLVTNVGFTAEATHTKNDSSDIQRLKMGALLEPVAFPMTQGENKKADRIVYRRHFTESRMSRVRRRLADWCFGRD